MFVLWSSSTGGAGLDRTAERPVSSHSSCLRLGCFVCLSVSLSTSMSSHSSHHDHNHHHPPPAPWLTPGCEGSQLGCGGVGGWRSRQRQKEGGREGEERREEEEEEEEEEDGSEVPTQFPCRHSGDQNVAENINSERNLLQKCETPLPVLCVQQTP